MKKKKKFIRNKYHTYAFLDRGERVTGHTSCIDLGRGENVPVPSIRVFTVFVYPVCLYERSCAETSKRMFAHVQFGVCT